MTVEDQRVLTAALRNDPMCFLWKVVSTIDPATTVLLNWSHEAIWEAFRDAIDGRASRVAVCAPPRSLKSNIASIAVPAWILGHDPTRKIVCITYSGDMATKLTNDFRRVVESDWYRKAFPLAGISSRKNTESETTFTAGGYRLGTSISGHVMGRGGDTVIVDDPMKSQDISSEARRRTTNQILQTTILSRLDDKRTGSIVVVMQRLHANDFVGAMLDASDSWRLLKLQAIATEDVSIPIGPKHFHARHVGDLLHPEREPREVLDQQLADMGPDAFDAQYQQEPAPPEGTIIKQQFIRYYDSLPAGGYNLISWDTAGKVGPRNSWSVGTVWYRKGDDHYLVDVVRGRFNYATLCTTAIELIKKYKPSVVLIEDAATGVALQSDILRDVSARVELIPVVGDKVGRLYLQQGKFAAGRVFLPQEAPFMPELLAELLPFPQSKFSDQVDSISQALAYVGSTYTLEFVR